MSIADPMDDLSALSRPSLPLNGTKRLPCLGMAVVTSEKLYRKKLRERMITARERKRWSQQIMADKLQIPLWRYQKAEQRGGLAPYLFEVFAALTDEDLLYLLTGERARAQAPPKPPDTSTTRRKPKAA